MKPYEFFEHTADIGMKAVGKSQQELFENALRGFYAAMGEFVTGGQPITHELELNAENVEELLVDFLREAHFLFDTRRWIFTAFEWERIDAKELKMTLRGGKADFEKSALSEEIKGITYHHLKVEQQDDLWSVTIVFDV